MKFTTKRLIELSIMQFIALVFFASVPVSNSVTKIIESPVLALEVKLITYGFLLGSIIQYATNTKRPIREKQSRLYRIVSAILATGIGTSTFLMTTTIVFKSQTAAAFFLFVSAIGIAVWITSSIFINTTIEGDQNT